jgi:integrase
MPNPAKGVKRNKEISRREYVPVENLPDLAKAIDVEENVYIRACFWLLLWTGMRRSEMLGCQWENVELDNRRIYLPETKAGEPQYVPLNDAAVAVLKDLPKMLGNPYVLPGHVKGKPLNNIDKPWRRIRDRAGLPRLRIHDLRRTAGSYMVQAGHSIHAVKDILRHKNTKTTEIYARLAEQQAHETVDAYGEALTEALKPKEAANE